MPKGNDALKNDTSYEPARPLPKQPARRVSRSFSGENQPARARLVCGVRNDQCGRKWCVLAAVKGVAVWDFCAVMAVSIGSAVLLKVRVQVPGETTNTSSVCSIVDVLCLAGYAPC